jgi:hypothetical protein
MEIFLYLPLAFAIPPFFLLTIPPFFLGLLPCSFVHFLAIAGSFAHRYLRCFSDLKGISV